MRAAVPRPAVHGGRAPADPPAGGVGRGRVPRPQPAHRGHLPHRLAQRQQVPRARHLLHQRVLRCRFHGVSPYLNTRGGPKQGPGFEIK